MASEEGCTAFSVAACPQQAFTVDSSLDRRWEPTVGWASPRANRSQPKLLLLEQHFLVHCLETLLGSQAVHCLSNTQELHSIMTEDAEPLCTVTRTFKQRFGPDCIFNNFIKWSPGGCWTANNWNENDCDVRFGVQNASYGASFERQNIWVLFLLPEDTCLPGKAGLVLVPGLVTVRKDDLHLSVPQCFCVLKRSRNLLLLPQGCED